MSDCVTCICCPLGCRILISTEGEKFTVIGHKCKKGEKYSIQEYRNPQRVLTTTVFVGKGKKCLLPVRSEREIPKHIVKSGVIELSKIKVNAPIMCGDLIFKNILGTGVNIIASCDMEMIER